MAEAPRAAVPWFLVAASVLLAVLLGYTLFAGYLPAKQRNIRLERELKEVYAREAELQTRLTQSEQRHVVRERELAGVTSERDAMVRRVDELERELARARRR